MGHVLNPDRIYVNLAAGGGGTSVSLSQYPEATVRENRFAPLVSNVGDYDVTVVRAELNGMRNLPLFIPSIVQGQPNGGLTSYAVTLTANLSKGATTTYPLPIVPALPAGAIANYRLDITTFDGSGNTATPWTSVLIPVDHTVASLATFAALIQTQIRAVNADPRLTTMLVTVSGTKLQFQSAPPGDSSSSFQLCIYLFGEDVDPPAIGGTTMPTLAQAFGFPALQPGASAYNYTLTSAGLVIIMPNSALYLPPVALPPLTSTQSLIWVPQNGFQLVDPRVTNTLDQPAYWCYDYDYFCQILNAALQAAANDLRVQASSKGYPEFSYQNPGVFFTAGTNLFSLLADANFTRGASLQGGSPALVGPGQLSGTVDIAFNGMLADLMMLPATFDTAANAHMNFNAAPISSVYPGYLQLTNNFSPTGSLWSPVDSLVFITQAIPVMSETTPPIFAANSVTSGAGAAVSTTRDAAQMLTDFVPFQTDASQWRTQTQIYSANPLRWVGISQGVSSGLLTLDFSMGWRNCKSGTVLPLLLNPQANFSVKLLFRRRGIMGAS